MNMAMAAILVLSLPRYSLTAVPTLKRRASDAAFARSS
jgi:hypothetical protein